MTSIGWPHCKPDSEEACEGNLQARFCGEGGSKCEFSLTRPAKPTSYENEYEADRPQLSVVVEHWMIHHVASLAIGTRLHYERVIRNHFQGILSLPIHEITSARVDQWIWGMIEQSKLPGASTQRVNFVHELQLLGSILSHYHEFFDDPHFRHPIKKRHRKMVHFKKVLKQKHKDMSLEDFHCFRETLKSTSLHGALLAAMVSIQFSSALRISEVAALRHCDISINHLNPHLSRITVCQHVVWLDRKGEKNRIEPGFKNATADEPTKELPMFPMAYEALKGLWQPGNNDLVFKNQLGTFFRYNTLRNYFNKAFELAGLPYTGTHVMRHGGTRWVFNETGDITLAQQLLGNRDLETTLVYAKRKKQALTEHVEKHWKEREVSCETKNPKDSK